MEQIARSATAAEIVYRIGAFVRGSKCKKFPVATSRESVL